MGIMAAFADELVKISAASNVVMPFLKANAKPLALVGAGATGYHLGKKELDKYMLGRQVYSQMQERQQ
jgi:hypothetical protein